MKTKHFQTLRALFSQIQVKNTQQKVMAMETAISKIVFLIIAQAKAGHKVYIIGNGGSASIASHIITDLVKNAGIAALAFNDPCLMSCISNDLGYENVFAKPLEVLAEKGDILFAISSSGKSENILRAIEKARFKGLSSVTFSGFDADNPLRKMGEINFYVPSCSYGDVEIIHLSLCHAIVDDLIKKTNHG